MQAQRIAFLQLLHGQVQYVVADWKPWDRFGWGQDEIERLVGDLLTIASPERDAPVRFQRTDPVHRWQLRVHRGRMRYRGLQTRIREVQTIDVVDGQHRFTTLSIILACIAAELRPEGGWDELTAQVIHDDLLTNRGSPLYQSRKLKLPRGDEEEYRLGLEGRPAGEGSVAQAWRIVRRLVTKHGAKPLLAGLERLGVDIIGVTESNFLEILHGRIQYVVQRTYGDSDGDGYCWGQDDIERLVDDLLTIASSEPGTPARSGHIDPVRWWPLCTSHGRGIFEEVKTIRVWDGHHRLTTLSIVLACIAAELGLEGRCGDWTAQIIYDDLLTNPGEPFDRRRKLKLQDGDEEEYLLGLEGRPAGEGAVTQAWRIVRRLVTKHGAKPLLRGLERLRVDVNAIHQTEFLYHLHGQVQYVVPRSHWRRYCWGQDEIERLVDSLLSIASTELHDLDDSVHGWPLRTLYEPGPSGEVKTVRVLHGQQRLTTLSIILACIAAELGPEGRCGDWTAQIIRDELLTNPRGPLGKHRKLKLHNGDEEEYQLGLEGRSEGGGAVAQAWQIVRRLVTKHGAKPLLMGLERLMVDSVEITEPNDCPLNYPLDIFALEFSNKPSVEITTCHYPPTTFEKFWTWLLIRHADNFEINQKRIDYGWHEIERILGSQRLSHQLSHQIPNQWTNTGVIYHFIHDATLLQSRGRSMNPMNLNYDELRRWAARTVQEGKGPYLRREFVQLAEIYGVITGTAVQHSVKDVERELQHLREMGIDLHRPLTLRLLHESTLDGPNSVTDRDLAKTLAAVVTWIAAWITGRWFTDQPAAETRRAVTALARAAGPSTGKSFARYWIRRIRRLPGNMSVGVTNTEAVLYGFRVLNGTTEQHSDKRVERELRYLREVGIHVHRPLTLRILHDAAVSGPKTVTNSDLAKTLAGIATWITRLELADRLWGLWGGVGAIHELWGGVGAIHELARATGPSEGENFATYWIGQIRKLRNSNFGVPSTEAVQYGIQTRKLFSSWRLHMRDFDMRDLPTIPILWVMAKRVVAERVFAVCERTLEASPSGCENFKRYWIDEIRRLRSSICGVMDVVDPEVVPPWTKSPWTKSNTVENEFKRSLTKPKSAIICAVMEADVLASEAVICRRMIIEDMTDEEEWDEATLQRYVDNFTSRVLKTWHWSEEDTVANFEASKEDSVANLKTFLSKLKNASHLIDW